jgi:hypothetical protein
MTKVDAKLEKVLAVWWSATHEGERQSFRAKAEMLAEQAGMTFDQALGRYLAIREGQSFQGAQEAYSANENFVDSTNEDFFDWTKRAWKTSEAFEARDRADRLNQSAEIGFDGNTTSEKASARASRRQQLIERFGSEAAVLAPCERERLLLDAVRPWRSHIEPLHERWDESLDGWDYGIAPAPPHIDAAIRTAFPLPENFPAAWSELLYWRTRDQDMQDILQDSSGDSRLGAVATARMRIVETLIERELIVRTPADLLERIKLHQEQDIGNDRLARLYADVEGIVAKSESHSPVASASPSNRRGQIEAALKTDPDRSDRSIARELGCSATTVGRARASLGLAKAPRSIQQRDPTSPKARRVNKAQ